MSVAAPHETLDFDSRLEGMSITAINALEVTGLPDGVTRADLEEAFGYLNAIELEHAENVDYAHSQRALKEGSEDSRAELQAQYTANAPVIAFIRELLSEGNAEVTLVLSGLARQWSDDPESLEGTIYKYPRVGDTKKWDPGLVDRLPVKFMPVANALFRKYNRNDNADSQESFDNFLQNERPDFTTILSSKEDQDAANAAYDYMCVIELAHESKLDKLPSLDRAKDCINSNAITVLRAAVRKGDMKVITMLSPLASEWQAFTQHPRIAQDRWSMNRDDMYDDFLRILHTLGEIPAYY